MVQINYLLGILTSSLLAANYGSSAAEIGIESGKMSRRLEDSGKMLQRRVAKAGKTKSDKGPDPDDPADFTGRFSGVDHASGTYKTL